MCALALPSDDDDGPDVEATRGPSGRTRHRRNMPQGKPPPRKAVVVPQPRALARNAAVVLSRQPRAAAVVVPCQPRAAVVVPQPRTAVVPRQPRTPVLKRPASLALARAPAEAKKAVAARGKSIEYTEPTPPVTLASNTYRVLELFSGTGSVGDRFKDAGHQVVSVDISDASGVKPTHQQDILRWNYTTYPPQFFHLIWASPPCEHYSRARTTATLPRDLPYYDSLVAKTREIIEWCKPRYYFIENPATGLLRTRAVVAGLNFLDVDYCKYGAPYRKRTRLWGQFPPKWTPRALCKGDCRSSDQKGRHLTTAQRLSGWSLNSLHRIPPALVSEIVNALD